MRLPLDRSRVFDLLDLLLPPTQPALKAERVDEHLVRVTGPCAVFDDPTGTERDLQGDYFTSGTFFSPRLAKGLDDEFEATWHHGFAMRPEYKGLAAHDFTNPVTTEVGEDALLASIILDERVSYEKAVAKAAADGSLGWSLGSANHRARKAAPVDGRSQIERWPIVEVALTNRPVEPRTVAVAAKSLFLAGTTDAPHLGTEAGKAVNWPALPGEGLNALRDRIQAAFRDEFLRERAWCWVVDVYPEHIVVCIEDDDHYAVDLDVPAVGAEGGSTITFAARADWRKVERTIVWTPTKGLLDTATETADLLREHHLKALADSIRDTLTSCGAAA